MHTPANTSRTRIPLLVTLLVIALLLPVAARAQDPSLLLNLNDFKDRAAIAQRQPWAKAQLDALMKKADSFPESYMRHFGLKTVELPPEGGQWAHYYVCPDTGTRLKYRPPTDNFCPDNGKIYHGWPYDQVVYQPRLEELGDAALTLGLAYRFSHNDHYAAESADLLKALADKYPQYPLHDNKGQPSKNGGKAFSQTLDESIWLINLAWSYDLVRGSGKLTAGDKKHIENDLLRASAAVCIKAHKEPTLNIQSWINGALAAVGYTLNDPAMISEAIDGPIGFRHQMHQFVSQGFWAEGSFGYQFYAMRPLTFTAQMATRRGLDLWHQEPALLTLFQGPLGIIYPDGRLPAFNDNGGESIFHQKELYESAYAATHDASLLPLIEHESRDDRAALLFGVETLPPAPPLGTQSQLFADPGFARLRSPSSDLTLVTKFGPHGGGHGHNDKLGFILYADGAVLAVDPGSQLYAAPTHKDWDKTTVAHNTIAVDEQIQAPATGKLIDWQSETTWTGIIEDAGPVYPNISIRRSIVLAPDYVLLVDHATSTDGHSHTFDWNYHNIGQQTLLNQLKLERYTAFPQRDGYNRLADAHSAQTGDPIHTRFLAAADRKSVGDSDAADIADRKAKPTSAVGVDLQVLPAPNTTLFTGTAPGPDLHIPLPYLILRRQGTSADFAVLLTPFTDSASLALTRTPDGSIQVQGKHFTDHIVLTDRIACIRTPR